MKTKRQPETIRGVVMNRIPRPIYEIHTEGRVVRFRKIMEVRAFIRTLGKVPRVTVRFPDFCEYLPEEEPQREPTTEERKDIIRQILIYDPLRSNRSISEEVGCSDHLVWTVREEMALQTPVRRRSNGKVQSITDHQRNEWGKRRLHTAIDRVRDVADDVVGRPGE